MTDDTRTNFEKLDDAGLVTDEVFEQHQATLNALPATLVDEIIVAFNAQEGTPLLRPRSESGHHHNEE